MILSQLQKQVTKAIDFCHGFVYKAGCTHWAKVLGQHAGPTCRGLLGGMLVAARQDPWICGQKTDNIRFARQYWRQPKHRYQHIAK
ncbi:hypothetical protein HW555_008822 [Spodoptera exigua]|uniref:Uncharacterized protein n=1 Tax=Spodoptera exigua TaxID=7107 RepID=A0A835L7F3_SPOEX|nr:hypothetical protein HW555_008822 [Spodoptera exigua]